jgi:hypothetical protein
LYIYIFAHIIVVYANLENNYETENANDCIRVTKIQIYIICDLIKHYIETKHNRYKNFFLAQVNFLSSKLGVSITKANKSRDTALLCRIIDT